MVITPFKVIDFGTNPKPICDFLLVTYILSRTVSKLLQIIGQIDTFRQTLVRDYEIWPEQTRKIGHNTCVWRRDVVSKTVRYNTIQAFLLRCQTDGALQREDVVNEAVLSFVHSVV